MVYFVVMEAAKRYIKLKDFDVGANQLYQLSQKLSSVECGALLGFLRLVLCHTGAFQFGSLHCCGDTGAVVSGLAHSRL